MNKLFKHKSLDFDLNTSMSVDYDSLIEIYEETKSDRFEVDMPEIKLIEKLISLAE